MSTNQHGTSYSGGIGLPGLLTLVFVALKLTGTIDWSWWWVLSPLWITAGLVLSLGVLVMIGVLVAIKMGWME